MHRRPSSPMALAMAAVMTSITFVLTFLVRVPTPGRGYAHLGDAGVLFAALAFGPWIGAASGGLGTALADVVAGYSQWAPFSLLIHGLQGCVAGWLWSRWQPVIRWARSKSQVPDGPTPRHRFWSVLPGTMTMVGLLVCAVLGGAIVVGGYFAAGVPLTGVGAAVGDIAFNIVQVTAGAMVGMPLYLLVRAAYPPVNRWNA